MAPQVDLMTELKMIQKGKCVWCTLGLPHPSYSRCERGLQAKSGREEKAGNGMDVRGGSGYASAMA